MRQKNVVPLLRDELGRQTQVHVDEVQGLWRQREQLQQQTRVRGRMRHVNRSLPVLAHTPSSEKAQLKASLPEISAYKTVLF